MGVTVMFASQVLDGEPRRALEVPSGVNSLEHPGNASHVTVTSGGHITDRGRRPPTPVSRSDISAGMVNSADAQDLGSCGATRGGSSPPSRTSSRARRAQSFFGVACVASSAAERVPSTRVHSGSPSSPHAFHVPTGLPAE